MNEPNPSDIAAVSTERRSDDSTLPGKAPEAWAFGVTPEAADDLLELLLPGVKTGIATSVWDYETSERCRGPTI